MSSAQAPRSTSTALSPNPSIPAYSDDLEWVTAYLVAHMLSDNSRVYSYLLWICVGFVLLIFTFLHLTGSRGGYIGAVWSKFAIRRRTWRGKSVLERALKAGKKANPTSLPPNGQILCLIALPIITFLMSFVGPDYLSPNIPVFDLDPSDLAARDTSYDPAPFYQYQPQYTIPKAWWTSGGRTGLIAFALMPLCVLFALKAPPFAIFALPFTTQVHFDKLAWLHRWSARLIWLMTLLHVVLWSVQLLLDHRSSTGKIGYTYAWQYEKFIYGWIAFAVMTVLIFVSSRPIRRAHYEAFYALHVLLVPLTLIMAALHHPPVWIWCWLALGIWLGERTWRFVWWLQMNGLFGKEKSAPVILSSTSRVEDTETQALRPWQHSDSSSSYPPPSPYLDAGFSAHSDGSLLCPATAIAYIPPSGFAHAELLSGATVRLTYITPGFLSWAPGQHFLINVPSVARLVSHPFTTASICDEQAPSVAGRAILFLVRCKNGWTRDLWDHVAKLISQGEKHVPGEKLPNGTVMPTNGVLLRMFVDGPFGSSVRAQWEKHSTIVIFVAGSGVSFGLSILEYVCLCLAGREGRHLGGRSGSWSSKGFKTRRVRFVWLIREYAHIQWCASILRRCMTMIPSPGLDIDIFVTNFKPPIAKNPPPPYQGKNNDFLTPPTPNYMKSAARSTDSLIESDISDETFVDLSYYTGEFGDEERDISTLPVSERENYILDLTNFDGDNDSRLPGEDLLNSKVRKAGRMHRAKSRFSRTFDPRRNDNHDNTEEYKTHNRGDSNQSGGTLAYLSNSTGPRDPKRVSTASTESELGRPVSLYSLSDPLPQPLSLSPASSPKSHSFLSSSAHLSSSDRLAERHTSMTDSASTSSALLPDRPTASTTTLIPPHNPTSPHSHGPLRPSPLSSLTPLNTSNISLPTQTKRVPPPTLSPSLTESGFDDPNSATGHGVQSRLRLRVEGQEMRDVSEVSVKVRPGKPKLDMILHDEVERARGSVVVACCGPSSFNAKVRKAIATEINPSRVWKGDRRGYIDLVSEEFEF